jgi:hypothetical protein
MDDDINLENAILYAVSSRGVYIPQFFAESIKRECVSGLESDPDAMADIIAGPYGCHQYWEAWDYILDNAVVTDPSTGQRYSLYQDGDLWLVPID